VKNKDIIRQQVYLAALLHDIGKFYQRADKSFADKQNELSKYSKKIANNICPVNEKGKFGYQHVVWTNEFFEQTQKIFDKIPDFKINPYENQDDNNLVTFACNHHKPASALQALVTLGDWWSAGIDRMDAENLKEKDYGAKNISWGKDRYKTVPLFSIFNKINNENGDFAFPLLSLNIERNLFPKKIEQKNDGVNEQQYNELWKKFIAEFEKLPTDSFDGFTDSLLFLLKKYTWAIPSNTMDMADVSLFEHLKTTAAFADSLYVYYRENEDDFEWNGSGNRLNLKENKYPVLLLGVDISGIQKFIYNIASSKAAKSLKGRSFYLQLLIDAMVQRIVSHQNIQASLGHIIYSSGGKFYMILPNTEKVKEALAELKKEFEQTLWNEHKGKISVNFGYSAFAVRSKKENDKWKTYIEIENEGNKELNLSTLWKSVADKINEDKNKPFASLLLNDENWDNFFGNGDDLKAKENAVICAVTGEELEDKNKKELDEDTEGNKIYVSKAVYDQIKLGTVLKDVDYLIVFKGNADDDKYLSGKSKAKITVFGFNYYLFDQKELTNDDADFRGITSADTSRVFRINNTDFLNAKLKGNGVSYGFWFYGGNKQAEINDKEKTFEQLTQVTPGNEKTETYLGVLRMDIDNLGNIFIKGFSGDEQSFAGYATLSFLLDWFFSGYLNTIRNNEKYRDWVNILYSGGDDVFAVGRWDKIIEFAREIQQDFTKFTGRKDITLSAGMATVRNKFPIAKAADLAGDAEDASKNYPAESKENKKEKNAFTFFGETVSWTDNYNFVEEYKNEFVNRIEGKYGKQMSKAILHRLMQFYEIRKENERKQRNDYKPDLSYIWNSAYYLKRFAERNNEHYNFIMSKGEYKEKGLVAQLVTGKLDNYDKIALSARWAELLLKTEIKENE
jgi:CRISPR-associated protein Csm1